MVGQNIDIYIILYYNNFVILQLSFELIETNSRLCKQEGLYMEVLLKITWQKYKSITGIYLRRRCEYG